MVYGLDFQHQNAQIPPGLLRWSVAHGRSGGREKDGQDKNRQNLWAGRTMRAVLGTPAHLAERRFAIPRSFGIEECLGLPPDPGKRGSVRITVILRRFGLNDGKLVHRVTTTPFGVVVGIPMDSMVNRVSFDRLTPRLLDQILDRIDG